MPFSGLVVFVLNVLVNPVFLSYYKKICTTIHDVSGWLSLFLHVLLNPGFLSTL